MPTLEYLSSPQSLDEFAKSVARNAEAAINNQSGAYLGAGIRTTEELFQTIIRGRSIDFDYDRLLEEASSYQ